MIERLDVLNVKPSDADGLRGLWEGICVSRDDPAQAYWRKMEAMLGYDLDDAPEELLEKLNVLKYSCGEMAIEEMMAAADDITRGEIERLPEEIERIRGEARSRAFDMTIPKVGEIREQMEASDACRQSKHYKSPRQRAVEVAAIVRTVWGLDRGPLPSEVLHDRLGISLQVLDQGGGENAAGVSAGFRGGSGNDLSVSLHENCRRDRRFLLARLIGDHIDLTESNERFLPATRAKTARQKFQCAFAQELLCPFEDLREFLDTNEPSPREIEQAASYFDVSKRVMEVMLVDEGVLDRNAILSY